MLFTDVQRSVRLNKKKKSTNTSPYPDEVIDRLARAFYPAILACWNSEEGQREFAAWQAEQAHHANNEKQEVPSGGELPAVHIAIVCGFNRKFYKQCNSQQLVCDMQFTVVANESNRELRWQGASAGAHPVFVLSESACGLFFWRIIRFNTQHPVADPHMGLNQMQRMCA